MARTAVHRMPLPLLAGGAGPSGQKDPTFPSSHQKSPLPGAIVSFPCCPRRFWCCFSLEPQEGHLPVAHRSCGRWSPRPRTRHLWPLGIQSPVPYCQQPEAFKSHCQKAQVLILVPGQQLMWPQLDTHCLYSRPRPSHWILIFREPRQTGTCHLPKEPAP
jgi:hypothetical protein